MMQFFPRENSDARTHKSQFEVLSIKQEFGQKIRENVGKRWGFKKSRYHRFINPAFQKK